MAESPQYVPLLTVFIVRLGVLQNMLEVLQFEIEFWLRGHMGSPPWYDRKPEKCTNKNSLPGRAPHNRFEGLDNGMITLIRPFFIADNDFLGVIVGQIT